MTTKEPTVVDGYEPTIGLEVHAQLLTKSKMFCACSADYAEAAPNSHVCAVCGGMPGALPVTNQLAVDFTVMTALALHCRVDQESKFDRKNYSYPDLPKGYQVSQYDRPIGRAGWLEYALEGERKRCGVTRVHLEEDTGKSLHTAVADTSSSLIDYNRSGVPLMEIVTEPELHTSVAARLWFMTLRQVLMYLGVCDGNLQKGSMRADVNVSVARRGAARGAKVEIKNLNSFRAVQRSIEFEIDRQINELTSGGEVAQETRGWSEAQEVTLAQRTKEYADDYRYFPEPDLPPLHFAAPDLERTRAELPELPIQRAERFEKQYKLSPYTAGVLTAERELAEYFERAVRSGSTDARTVANWVSVELAGLLNAAGLTIIQSPVTPEALAKLVALVSNGTIGGKAGKAVLEETFQTGDDPETIVERRDLGQVGDREALTQLVDEIIGANPTQIEEYRKGKANVLTWFVGQVMKQSRGKAKPDLARELLQERLGSREA